MEKWNPEQRFIFLAQRLKKLTQAQQANKQSQEVFQGIAFVCKQESFMIPLHYITQIVMCPKLTPIASGKEWFLGLMNLRGDIIPISDLQSFLYHENTKIEKNTPIVVVRYQGEWSGILINHIKGLYSITTEKPVPFLMLKENVFAPYNEEVIQYKKEIFPIFNIFKLIEDPLFANAT